MGRNLDWITAVSLDLRKADVRLYGLQVCVSWITSCVVYTVLSIVMTYCCEKIGGNQFKPSETPLSRGTYSRVGEIVR